MGVYVNCIYKAVYDTDSGSEIENRSIHQACQLIWFDLSASTASELTIIKTDMIKMTGLK